MAVDRNKLDETKVELLSKFDFEKVQRVMQFLGWTWRDEGVPTVESMRHNAGLLLDFAIKNGGVIEAGGLRATFREEDDGYLCLDFVLETVDVDDIFE